MIKYFLISILVLILSSEAYSQKINPDTIVIKKDRQYLLSNFAMQYDLGATKYFYDDKTEKYFDDHWGFVFRVNFFYKKWELGFGILPASINTNDTLYFVGKKLYNNARLNIIKYNLVLGYHVDWKHNYSIEPYAGVLGTDFKVVNESDINQTFNFNSVTGFTFGFVISKYIQVKPDQFVTFFLTTNYNISNYSNFHPFLGDNFFATEFGVGYKGWFLKKVNSK